MSPMLALYSWPVIGAYILSKLRLPLAILVVMFAGYLFLPVKFAIDFPMVPPMGKHAIPALTIMVVTMMVVSLREAVPHQPGLLPKSRLALVLMVFVVLGAIGTAMTNGDRIVTPLEVKRGLSLYDGVSMAIGYVLLLLPVLIGRKYFARPETHRLILIVFCLAACGYAFLALFEVRMSPRLNRWVYGFTPHDWRMHVRGGGFRPMVFLEHGLRVSLFFALALIAAVGLFRMGWKVGYMLLAIGWLAATLVLSKSLGALMIAALVIPMVFFFNTRLLILAAALIGMMVLTYPILRGGGYVPVDHVMNFAESVNEKRAGSLRVRLENEEILLTRAAVRPAFGWGGFGRSRVRNEKGFDVTTPDGYWVILIGRVGWVNYIGQFGLMTAPMLLLFLHRRRYDISYDTAILSVLLAANMIDLIPNSGHSPMMFLIVGALWGRLELQVTPDDEGEGDGQASLKDPIQDTKPQYARDFGTKPPPRKRKHGSGRQSAIQVRQRRYTGRADPTFKEPT